MCRSHKNNTPRVLHRLWDPVFSTDLGTPCFHDRPRRPGTLHPGPALSSKPSVNASRSDIGTVPLFLACVASVSNRVIARKLEWEQKKRWKRDWEGRRGSFFPLPLPRHSFFLLSTNSRGNACYEGYSFFLVPPPRHAPGTILPNARPTRYI